jgi:protein gp37
LSDDTKIEWTDATWNPLRGCSRVSEGCRNCYAERVAARFCKPGEAYHGVAKNTAPRDRLDAVGGRRNGWTGEVKLVEEHLADPLRWRRPRKVFVNSMSDLFHPNVPDGWIDRIFAVMALAPQHTFQVLTKRPERMRAYLSALTVERLEVAAAREFGDEAEVHLANWINGFSRPRSLPDDGNPLNGTVRRWPLPNVWVGTSVEDQSTADERIPLLLSTPAAVRFASYEPALGAVDFTRIRSCSDEWAASNPPVKTHHSALSTHCGYTEALDWVIVGGESGPGARPFDVAWARSTIAACNAAGVACFVKQLGAGVSMHRDLGRGVRDSARDGHAGGEAYIPIRDRKGGDWNEWPEDLRVREFPAVRA